MHTVWYNCLSLYMGDTLPTLLQHHHNNPMGKLIFHDEVIKWKHFPRYWPFVRVNHRSPGNSPHKGQWCGALMFSLVCAWTNTRDTDDLRCHRAHYDVTIMLAFHVLDRPCPGRQYLTVFSVRKFNVFLDYSLYVKHYSQIQRWNNKTLSFRHAVNTYLVMSDRAQQLIIVRMIWLSSYLNRSFIFQTKFVIFDGKGQKW